MSNREKIRVGGSVSPYKAFISYTSQDSLFVDKLEEWLIDLSTHIDPTQNYKFFRDRTHSDAGENVEEGLKQRLEEAEWLILVCSPSVNVCKEGERNWVDFECSYFAKVLGRKEKIVSMIADTAPNDRNVASFYPESVRDLHKKLAADMRGDKKWSQEVSRVYAEITEQSFESIYDVAQTFYWEREYYERIPEAYKKNLDGDAEGAVRLLSEIPLRYNPGKLEWSYLLAVCSRSAFSGYCGRTTAWAGSQVICYDRESACICTTDSNYLYVVNCLEAEIKEAVLAHEGAKFRTFYIGDQYFGTFDDKITVKIWKYEEERLSLVNQVPLEIRYTQREPAAFKSFYMDCKIENIPMTYDACHRLFAISVRHDLFLLEIDTGEYRILDIPSCRKDIMQRACMWKRIYFSNEGGMIFLADEWYILGWDLQTGEHTFFWNRMNCRPRYAHYEATNTYQVEGTAYTVHTDRNAWEAELKDGEKSVMHFPLLSGKKLNSVYMGRNADDLIALYEDATVQMIRRNLGVVYSEESPIAKKEIAFNIAQPSCPVVLRGRELWYALPQERIQTVPMTGDGYSIWQVQASCQGWAAVTDNDRKEVSVYDEKGKLWKARVICRKEQPEPLSPEELQLQPGTYSSLMLDLIRKRKDKEIFQCVCLLFLDRRTLMIGCTKGYVYQWKLEEDLLIRMDDVHEDEISSFQPYSQWHTLLTVDRAGAVGVWKSQTGEEWASLKFSYRISTGDPNILVQLVSPNEVAVFYRGTGELILYKRDRGQTVLLSKEAMQGKGIGQALSMYVSQDQSRLVLCTKRAIDFIRIPDGKTVLESTYGLDLAGMRIYDSEKRMDLFCCNGLKETHGIEGLTEEKFTKVLKARRETYFKLDKGMGE